MRPQTIGVSKKIILYSYLMGCERGMLDEEGFYLKLNSFQFSNKLR